MSKVEEEVSMEQMQQHYENLLLEYNSTKDVTKAAEQADHSNIIEVDKISSLIEDIELQLAQPDQSQQAGHNDRNIEAELTSIRDKAASTQELIETEKGKSQEQQEKANAEIADLEAKLTGKEQEIGNITVEDNPEHDPEATQLQSKRQQLEQTTVNRREQLARESQETAIKQTELAKARTENEQLQKESKSSQQGQKSIAEELENLKAKIGSTQESTQQKSEEISQVNTNKNDESKELARVQEKSKQLEELEQDKNMLLTRISQSKEEGASQIQEVAALEGKSKDVEQAIKTVEKEIKARLGQNDKLTADIRILSKKRKEEADQKDRILRKEQKGLLIKTEQEIQYLQKDLERQEKKLSDLTKVQATYVSYEKIAHIKTEHNRLKDKAYSAEQEEKRNKKLAHENKHIVDRIGNLQKAEKETVETIKAEVAGIRERAQQLKQEREYYEKSIELNQQKAVIYGKEYPQHEEEKLLRKQEEKDRRQEEKRLRRQDESHGRNQNIRKDQEDQDDDDFQPVEATKSSFLSNMWPF